MRALYQSPFYTEGLFDPDGFHLDPLALARGYARAARDRGARLFETSPVLRLARHGAGWRLATADGSVEARHVVLCTNAHGDALLPALRAGLLPVASYVIVTEPLGRRLTDVIRAPYAVYDDRFATGYYRPLADGRLLWGGRIALRERPASLPALMLGDLARIYPQLEAVRLDAAWSGRMSFARHRMPILGELAPGLWANTAYGGHGLNGTTMGGELVARAIAQGDPAITLFRAFPPRPVFGLLGRLAAQGFYWGHALGDAARRRRTRRRPRGEKGEGTAPSRDPSK
jgi:gamma-glutamylputrescine oxidase